MRAIIASVMLGYAAAEPALASQYAARSAAPTTAPMTLQTAKERLGAKATDEQRVNDCKVPSERRSRTRPTTCPWDRESQSAVAGGPAGTGQLRNARTGHHP